MYRSMLTVLAFAATLAACEAPESPQQRAIASELRSVDGHVERLGAAVAARAARIAGLQRDLDTERTREAHLLQAARGYMLEHKMAVAVIALGLGGAGVAFSEDSSLSDEARALGGAAGMLAVAYAIANADEVLGVFDELGKADAALGAARRNARALAATLAQEEASHSEEAGTLARTEQRAAQLRTALAAPRG